MHLSHTETDNFSDEVKLNQRHFSQSEFEDHVKQRATKGQDMFKKYIYLLDINEQNLLFINGVN